MIFEYPVLGAIYLLRPGFSVWRKRPKFYVTSGCLSADLGSWIRKFPSNVGDNNYVKCYIKKDKMAGITCGTRGERTNTRNVEDGCLLGCSGRCLPTFQKCLLPPSSGRLRRHHPEGGSKHLRNVGKFLPDYTAQHPRKQPSPYSPLWEPEISIWNVDWKTSRDENFGRPRRKWKDNIEMCLVQIVVGLMYELDLTGSR
jgi:hypothetical protein